MNGELGRGVESSGELEALGRQCERCTTLEPVFLYSTLGEGGRPYPTHGTPSALPTRADGPGMQSEIAGKTASHRLSEKCLDCHELARPWTFCVATKTTDPWKRVEFIILSHQPEVPPDALSGIEGSCVPFPPPSPPWMPWLGALHRQIWTSAGFVAEIMSAPAAPTSQK